MNIKPVLAAVILLCLSFTSFSQPKAKMTPLEYNDYFGSIMDSLYNKGQSWGAKFMQIQKGDQDFSKLKSLGQSIESFIVLKKKEVEKTPPVGKSGEEFKQAMLSFINYELNTITTIFRPIENLTSSSTEKEIADAVDKLLSQSDKEEYYIKMASTAQAFFAKENGFIVEESETD